VHSQDASAGSDNPRIGKSPVNWKRYAPAPTRWFPVLNWLGENFE
jgi:hypothetical protein